MYVKHVHGLIVRLTLNLMGLEDVISVNFDPIVMTRRVGHLEKAMVMDLMMEGFSYLSEAYFKTDSAFKGRITVPYYGIKTRRSSIIQMKYHSDVGGCF